MTSVGRTLSRRGVGRRIHNDDDGMIRIRIRRIRIVTDGEKVRGVDILSSKQAPRCSRLRMRWVLQPRRWKGNLLWLLCDFSGELGSHQFDGIVFRVDVDGAVMVRGWFELCAV